jgi:hypothetical protein
LGGFVNVESESEDEQRSGEHHKPTDRPFHAAEAGAELRCEVLQSHEIYDLRYTIDAGFGHLNTVVGRQRRARSGAYRIRFGQGILKINALSIRYGVLIRGA